MWEDLSHECHQVVGFHLSFFLGVGGGESRCMQRVHMHVGVPTFVKFSERF